MLGSDTNSIDAIDEDVAMHVHPMSAMEQSGNHISLKNTLDMQTGAPIPNTGLEQAQLFLTTRRDDMREFYKVNKLVDARGEDEGIMSHTCHFAWMR